MSGKLTNSESFADFFDSMQSFYISMKHRTAGAAEARGSEAAKTIAAVETPNKVLLGSPRETEMLEEKNTPHLMPTVDLLQCSIDYSNLRLVTQIEGSTAQLSTSDTIQHNVEHDGQSYRERSDTEYSNQKLITQVEVSLSERSTKDRAWHATEHYEAGGKPEDTYAPNAQQKSLLSLPLLHESKWAKPSAPGPTPTHINVNASQSIRQGRSQHTEHEPNWSSYDNVATTSLHVSKWAINKGAEQLGAVTPTHREHTVSSSSINGASSGLGLSGKDAGGGSQEKSRQHYSREFLLTFSEYRIPPLNMCGIISTIWYDATKPKVNVTVQATAMNAINREKNRRDKVTGTDTLPAKTESAHSVAHPSSVRSPSSPTKPSPNVQQSRASHSGSLGGKVFCLPKSRDPRSPPSSCQKGFQR